MPIYDQSYAHWKGRLEGHVFRWLPITLNGIRLAFRPKLLRILFLLALAPFVIRAGMIVLFHYVEALQTDMDFTRAIRADGQFYHNFILLNQAFGVIVICLFAGSPLLARDMKSGALELYFSKPLLLSDYLIGKFMVIASYLACMTLFPSLIIFLLDVILSEQSGHFGEAVGCLPGIFTVSLLVITTCSLLVMAASACARRPRNAAVVWFSFHVALFIAAEMISRILQNSNFKLLDIRNSLAHLSRSIFGLESSFDWHWSAPLIYLVLLMGGSILILLRQVKGVEVVKS